MEYRKNIANNLPILFLLLLFSCSGNSESGKIAVAKVYDKYLYLDEVQAVLPKEISKNDSLTKANAYVDLWIRQQLIIKKAELSLSAQEKDVEKQLNDYRNSLIVFKFQEKFLNEKLDTTASEQAIETFYREHTQEFILSYNIVKAMYIRVPRDLPDLNQIKGLCRSNYPEADERLAELCKKNALAIDFYEDKWTPFTSILIQRNIKIENQEEFLRKQQPIEITEGDMIVLVKIKDYKLINDVTPLSLVKANIKGIVLTKRKNELVRDLEKTLYENALQNGNVQYLNTKDSK